MNIYFLTRSLAVAAAAAASLLCVPSPASEASKTSEASRATDTTAIRALEARQELTWNTHDAHAYAQLFTPDADTVNVLGWWWKSRAELEKNLATGFAFVFAHSQLHIEAVTIRFLTGDVAIAHVQWTLTGALSPDGSGKNIPQKGIQTQALHKTAAGWQIAAFQNANAVPERSFPQKPG